MSHPARRVLAIQWHCEKHNEPVIAIPVGPRRTFITFLIDTGAQISVITKETAESLNGKLSHHKVKFTGIDGIIKECPTAKITLWLPGETKLTRTEVLIGAANTNMLVFDLLYGRMWKLPDGTIWSFAG